MDKRTRRWNMLVPIWSLLAATLVSCATPTASPPNKAAGTATATIAAAPAPSATWQANTGSPDTTTLFVFAPSDPQIGYLCTGGRTERSKGPRLYKTSDGGKTWKAVATEPSGDLPCRVFIDAADPNDIFLQQVLEPGANFGPPLKKALWRSQDGGKTWRQLSVMSVDGWRSLAVVGARLVAEGDVFPNNSGGGERPCDPARHPGPTSDLWASDDGGMTWHSIGQAIERQQLTVEGMATMGTTVFAQADTLPKNACDRALPVSSLWKSTNGGTTWAKVALPACKLLSVSFAAKADGGGFAGVALAQGCNRAHPAMFDVLYSGDSGSTWTPLPAFAPLASTPVDANTGGPPNLAVTPSGAAVAEFTVLTDSGSPQTRIYLLRPGDTSPAWSAYAPGGASGNAPQWQTIHGTQGDGLWGLGYTLSGSPLAYLPLP